MSKCIYRIYNYLSKQSNISDSANQSEEFVEPVWKRFRDSGPLWPCKWHCHTAFASAKREEWMWQWMVETSKWNFNMTLVRWAREWLWTASAFSTHENELLHVGEEKRLCLWFITDIHYVYWWTGRLGIIRRYFLRNGQGMLSLFSILFLKSQHLESFNKTGHNLMESTNHLIISHCAFFYNCCMVSILNSFSRSVIYIIIKFNIKFF